MWVVFNASAVFALAACGGGGGKSNEPSAPITNPPPASNAAPVVTTSVDQTTLQLPANSVQLTGGATDDGLPANSTLVYAWTSSPAGVTFANPAAASTGATFAGAGTYTLTLSVSDGALSGASSVQVVVQAAAGGGNTAPVVNAGADQAINLPAKVKLQGAATDDGLPSSTLTYQWSAGGGATGVTFVDATAAATTASFAAAGVYELILSVSDGALSGSDSVMVTVGAAIFPAADTNDVDPDRGWARVAAADVGMDQALLTQAQTYAQTAGGSGMVVKGGQLVHSWGAIDDRYPSQSATKSIGGMVLGLAIDDGLVALSDLAVTHLPTVGVDPDPPPANDPTQLAQITMLQLATHTAGFEKDGGYGALIYTPGTTWSYSDGGLNWLADVLTNVFAQDLRTVVTSRIWATLGLNNGDVNNGDDIVWRAAVNGQRPDPRPSGIEHRELASGMIINANAMARVGLLFLRNGEWSNTRVLSESFVTTVRTPRPSVAAAVNADPTNFPGATTNYGVLWWTNAEGLLPVVPRDAYWAWGQGDSLVVVIPSLDLVVSRIGPIGASVPGRVFGESNWNADYSVLAPFLQPIVCSADPTLTGCP